MLILVEYTFNFPSLSSHLTPADVDYDISSTGAITVAETLHQYGETTTYWHWVICEADTRYKVGLVRIDTFDKNENMVAVVTSNSAADVTAQK